MYQYETHLHTYESSLCAATPATDYIHYYKALGYQGIFITDHFFNGNTRITSKGTWEDRIHAYCNSYSLAKEAGDSLGLKVFQGLEYHFQGDEFLLYGMDENWLIKHPEIMEFTRLELFQMMDQEGFLMIQAHPFRERDYLNTIYVNPDACHGMEAYNGFNPLWQNHNAELFCQKHGIYMTAGSDLHKIGTLEPDAHFGMIFDYPIQDTKDYVDAIREKKGSMKVPLSYRKLPLEIKTELPLIINQKPPGLSP